MADGSTLLYILATKESQSSPFDNCAMNKIKGQIDAAAIFEKECSNRSKCNYHIASCAIDTTNDWRRNATLRTSTSHGNV